MLKYMRENDEADPADEEVSVAVVIPVDLFDKFEEKIAIEGVFTGKWILVAGNLEID